jgi:hypothetical protein
VRHVDEVIDGFTFQVSKVHSHIANQQVAKKKERTALELYWVEVDWLPLSIEDRKWLAGAALVVATLSHKFSYLSYPVKAWF